MPIATFSPPIRAVAQTDSLPRILIAIETGLTDRDGNTLDYFWAVDMDGKVDYLTSDKVIVDWRYDPKTELWGDASGAAVDSADDV